MTILDLAQQAGIKPKWVASTNGGEYHSSCPSCGGKDRFYIQPFKQMSKCNGFYCCRQCGISGDAIQFARQFLHYSFKEAVDAVNAIIPHKELSLLLKRPHAQRMTTLVEPPAQWTIQATQFVEQAHKQLLLKPDILTSLAHRGIPINIIEQYKFGWSESDQFLIRSDWGLQKKLNIDGKPQKLWIPKGLVIPVSKLTGQIIKLKIRRQDWHDKDKLPKYVAISGSMNGLNLIGNIKHKIMIVVESELDAYAINHATSNFALVIAVGSSNKNPDNVTDRLAKHATKLLVCHDNDAAGQAMCKKWRNLYPHAQNYPTPIGKDIGEAIEKGLNIREWLLKILQH